MSFTISSPFTPQGDQPRAIRSLVGGLKDEKKFQTLLGVTGSGKTYTMANVISTLQRPTLVLAHNKTLAAQLAAEFRSFFPDAAVTYFVSYYDYYQPESYLPTTDTYIAKETQINQEIDRLRHVATMSLLTRRDVIVVASVSCIYGLGAPEEYNTESIQFKKGGEISHDDVLKQLVSMQYQRNDIDLRRGTFTVRGDILEIFPSYEEYLVRITFFGDEVESIQEVDGLTGEILQEFDEIDVFPASHYATNMDQVKRVLPMIREELVDRLKVLRSENRLVEAQRLEERTKYDLEMLEATGFCSGIENYSRYFSNLKPGQAPYTLIDYFPDDFLMVIDESHITIPQVRGMYNGDQARKRTLVEHGFRLPSALDNRPLNFDEFQKKLNQVVFVSATPEEYELNKSGKPVEQLIRPTGLLDPEVEIRPIEGQIDDLVGEINKRIERKERVLVTTLTKRMSEELTDYLNELGIKVQYIHSDIDALERLEILRDLRLGVFDVVVGINLLREGLDLPEVSLVAIMDADKEGYLRSRTALIQTMGRAARHVEGRVIMYADRMTKSMKAAIGETERRRIIQSAYNVEHGITPQSVKKEISEDRLAGKRKETPKTTRRIKPGDLEKTLAHLEEKMNLAAENLEFEYAAELRDEIEALKKEYNVT